MIAASSLATKGVVLVYCGSILIFIIREGVERVRGRKISLASLDHQSLLTAALFLGIYTTLFATSVYGDIPATLGGGQPQRVRLIIDEEAKERLIVAGIRFSDQDLRSEPVHLVLATSETYLVLPSAQGRFLTCGAISSRL